MGAADLVVQAQILRGGVLLGSAAPEPIAPSGPPGPPLPHTTRIKLDRFEPGEYELRMTVTDRIGGALVARQLAFQIE